MELKQALAAFDGRHTDTLKRLVRDRPFDGEELLALCREPDVEVAATWVLKALLENGVGRDWPLSRVFAALPEIQAWEAQLHVLQCVQFAPEAALGVVEDIENLMQSDRTLVRVWAMDALVRVADEQTNLRPRAEAHVAAALAESAASLRARARALKVICEGW